jgi:hypothetical protein
MVDEGLMMLLKIIVSLCTMVKIHLDDDDDDDV